MASYCIPAIPRKRSGRLVERCGLQLAIFGCWEVGFCAFSTRTQPQYVCRISLATLDDRSLLRGSDKRCLVDEGETVDLEL